MRYKLNFLDVTYDSSFRGPLFVLAGNPGLVSVINSLVVVGEVAIGVALILGVSSRFAGVMGALLMGFIIVAAWSFALTCFLVDISPSPVLQRSRCGRCGL